VSGTEYFQAIQEWRVKMDADLRREKNLLALAGLFWLRDGYNTFGSSPDNDILLPDRAPRLIGAFGFDNNSIRLHIETGQSGELNGKPIRSGVMLNTDHEDQPNLIKFEELRLVVFRRADRLGVYVWDDLRPRQIEFPPRTWFPVDEKHRVTARYTPYLLPIKVDLPNSFGEIENDMMLGYVTFKFGDKNCKLDATELPDGSLYLQFNDLTNGGGTYPGGRYLITEEVAEDGQVIIDFNKSYNPPSAFNQYTLCTYASKKNHLNVAMDAGELYERPH
jgi:uncharacterized protein (DUF1684 family)